jgi:transposase
MKEPKQIHLSEPQANELLQRLENAQLSPKDYELLALVLKSWLWLSAVVRSNRISIKELKKLLFGAKTEKTRNLLKSKTQGKENAEAAKGKPKGHGRNGADAYSAADRVCLKCLEVRPGERCPKCGKGRLYAYAPSAIVSIQGQAPLQATVYEQEKLRCNLCGAWFAAPKPPEAAGPKYDPSAASMIAVLHYGSGMPFNRLDALQANLGIPLPSSTQWDVVKELAAQAQPVFDAISRYAAGGEIFFNDDTKGRVLALEKNIAEELEACRAQGKECRTGVFTTAIISEREGRRVSLFFTGRQHAGENLGDLLEQRPDGLPTPIQMCDALSRNAPSGFKRLLANCLCHGRREFVKLLEEFPDHCRHVLETLREVYKNDAFTKHQRMSKQARLAFHQQNSKPIMDGLFNWMNAQLDEKKVEPNSRMGGAINYMLKHWKELTLFLRVPGAPLDNNLCERALKTPIRHRNNSLFFKTERGALVGDVLMSLIHSCRLNEVNAFEYLRSIAQYSPQLAAAPLEWLPWNYHKALIRCASP